MFKRKHTHACTQILETASSKSDNATLNFDLKPKITRSVPLCVICVMSTKTKDKLMRFIFYQPLNISSIATFPIVNVAIEIMEYSLG